MGYSKETSWGKLIANKIRNESTAKSAEASGTFDWSQRWVHIGDGKCTFSSTSWQFRTVQVLSSCLLQNLVKLALHGYTGEYLFNAHTIACVQL